ncbi:MAG: trans-sulfuration enzyme family protein [Flavobacteriaceae bacterium]
MKKNKGFSTHCVHTGTLDDEQFGGVGSPLYTSTSYPFDGVEENRYPRYFNTPNQQGLARKIAALERGETGLIFSSGMAAISTALLGHLQKGDHVVFQDDLYGGTRNFIKECFPKYGIEFSFTSGHKIKDFEAAIQPNTRGIYVETPSNPLLHIIDLKSLSVMAKDHQLWTMIDNTFASPVNQNPLALGIDVVVHSATKYLGGHSDISAGAVVSRQDLMAPIYGLAKNLGGNLSDQTVWLLERSLKTLKLRVDAQTQNALTLAQFLDQQAEVARVYYPGLGSHPGHLLAQKQMQGFGAMLSFDLKTMDALEFCQRLHLIKPSMSLAGVESTVISPPLASHALLTPEERQSQGISDRLIRFSVGIETVEDLQQDLNQALNR